MRLVIGRENSGKSALAEKLFSELKADRKYYLATMKVCDEAGERRVIKHRRQREGKGFITLEIQRDICGALKEMKNPQKAAVLLECLSNLIANELFEGMGKNLSEAFALPEQERLSDSDILAGIEGFSDEIVSQIEDLASKVSDLVIVTGEFEEDGRGYDEETRLYVRTLKSVNEKLRPLADKVYECG